MDSSDRYSLTRTLIASLPAFIALNAPLLNAADPLDTWHLRAVPESAAGLDLEGVAYGNGRWVAVGEDGLILSSADGVNWTTESNPAGTRDLNDVAFGNGLFVAVGSGRVVISNDGQQWTQQTPKNAGARSSTTARSSSS